MLLPSSYMCLGVQQLSSIVRLKIVLPYNAEDNFIHLSKII